MTHTPILLDEDLVRAAQILEETAHAIKLSNAVGKTEGNYILDSHSGIRGL